DRLWCMHHIGTDEVHPAPDFETAQQWANWANLQFAEYQDISRFVVAVWPWDAESHAHALPEAIDQWEMPTALPGDVLVDSEACEQAWQNFHRAMPEVERATFLMAYLAAVESQRATRGGMALAKRAWRDVSLAMERGGIKRAGVEVLHRFFEMGQYV